MEEKAKRKFYQKWWFWVIVSVVFLGAIGSCGDDTSDSTANSAPVEIVAEEAVTFDVSEQVVEEGMIQPSSTSSQDNVTQNSSSNYLESLSIQTADVWNGLNTEVIGEYAYILADKEITKAMTEKEFYSFAKNVVDDSGYNWFTIDFGDTTGIQFAGSMMSLATYGEIDSEKCITNVIGFIVVTEESVTYEEE